jgi:hypothetical protein
MTEPEPVKITFTERGFLNYGDPMTTDYDHKVTVRQSSAALVDAVWLFVDGSVQVDPASHDPNYDRSMGGDHVYRQGHVGVHLTAGQAKGLVARLQAWIDGGETMVPTRVVAAPLPADEDDDMEDALSALTSMLVAGDSEGIAASAALYDPEGEATDD